MTLLWTWLRTRFSLTPEQRFRLMMSFILVLLVLATFLSGFFIGRGMARSQCEMDASRAKVLAMDAENTLQQEIIHLQATHRQENDALHRRLMEQEKSRDRLLADILHSNPHVARWYHAPINDVERAVMYGTGSELLTPRPARKPATAAH